MILLIDKNGKLIIMTYGDGCCACALLEGDCWYSCFSSVVPVFVLGSAKKNNVSKILVD